MQATRFGGEYTREIAKTAAKTRDPTVDKASIASLLSPAYLPMITIGDELLLMEAWLF
jgi:hypothetical protein